MKQSCDSNSCKLPKPKAVTANVKIFKIIAAVLAVIYVITGFWAPYESAVVFFTANDSNYGCVLKDGIYQLIIATFCLLACALFKVLSDSKNLDKFTINFFGFLLHYITLAYVASRAYHHVDFMGGDIIFVGYALFFPIYFIGRGVGFLIIKLPAYKKWRDDFESVYLPENVKQ